MRARAGRYSPVICSDTIATLARPRSSASVFEGIGIKRIAMLGLDEPEDLLGKAFEEIGIKKYRDGPNCGPRKVRSAVPSFPSTVIEIRPLVVVEFVLDTGWWRLHARSARPRNRNAEALAGNCVPVVFQSQRILVSKTSESNSSPVRV
jgi:hypothetical protein